jgi:hypothetical protein
MDRTRIAKQPFENRVWSVVVRAVLICAAALLPQGAAAADDLQSFVATYRCEVLRRIDYIHDAVKVDIQNRFVILGMRTSPLNIVQTYVQCAYDDDLRHMMCEAASGFYADVGARTAFLPKDSVAALARLGFSTDDSKGNFAQRVDANGDNGRAAVAELLLKALYLAYGARSGMRLEVTTPLLHEEDVLLDSSKCPAIS